MPSSNKNHTKRKTTSKQTGQSDFKRLKAKVGKRALKPANLTDTSFRSASLHVGNSSSVVTTTQQDGSLLLSSRGKSLDELVSQLGHPSSNVRLSAVKGLGNLAQPTQEHLLAPHLSTFLPAAAKACVDGDDAVRTEALSVLERLLRSQQPRLRRPFGALLVAYTSSALNSLDSDMRVDGTQMVWLLCRFWNLGTFDMFRPFGSILGDDKVRRQTTAMETVLNGLVALLKVSIGEERNEKEKCTPNEEDLIVVAGGRGRCALLLEREPPVSHGLRQCKGINELPTLEDLTRQHSSVRGGPPTDGLSHSIPMLDVEPVYDVLSKLRDLLIETTDQETIAGHPVSTAQSSSTIALNLDKLQRLVHAIRLLWKYYGSLLEQNKLAAVDDVPMTKMTALGQQLASLISEFFPITLEDVDIGEEGRHVLDATNALIASTMMDVAKATDTNKSSDDTSGTKTQTTNTSWVTAICLYILPRMEAETSEATTSVSPSLEVFCSLLRVVTERPRYRKRREAMLQTLHDTFFSKRDIVIARSAPARKVAVVISEIVLQECERSSQDALLASVDGGILVVILQTLPFFLVSWGADFVYETGVVMELLFELSRRMGAAQEFRVLQALPTSISPILETTRTAAKSKTTVFEQYPVQLQRLFLALLSMFGAPSAATLNGLASISSRSNRGGNGVVSMAVNDEILEVVHGLRMSLPLQDFLSFLINSLGVPKVARKLPTDNQFSLDVSRICMLDEGVERLCNSLIRCGTRKVFPMLAPQLASWLTAIPSDAHSKDVMLRSRVVVSVVAFLSLDYFKVVEDCDTVSLLDLVPRELRKALEKSLVQFLERIASDEELMAHRTKLVAPISCLLQQDTSLAKLVREDSEYFSSEVSTTERHNVEVLKTLVRSSTQAAAVL